MNNQLIYGLVAVPILMLLGVAIWQPMYSTSAFQFEETIADELLGNLTLNGTTMTTAYPMKLSSLTSVSAVNGTGDAVTCYLPTTITYNDYLAAASFAVNCEQNASTVAVYADYTGYTGGYTRAIQINSGVNAGFGLGSQLPFVYIAIAVISVILGAFGLSRVFG